MLNLRRTLMQPVSLPQPAKMADGGLIRLAKRLVGNSEEAQQLRGRGYDQVMAPAPAAPPAQPRETAAPITAENPNGLRFADGGNYRMGYNNGGKVVGPGTGTSDSVPARYSNGEYVLPADTAEHIGYDKLDAIKDATHTPAAVQRGLRMANGGMAYDSDTNIPGGLNARNQSPAYKAIPGIGPQDASVGPGAGGVLPPVGGERNANSLRGGFLDPVTGAFPGSRAVGRGFTEDLQAAGQQPSMAAKIGMGAYATGKAMLAAPLGLAEDVLEPATRFLRPVTTGAVNAANTAVTGNAKPLLADPADASSAAPPAATPTPAPAAPAASNVPGQDASMPGQDPGRGPMLRGMGGMDMGGGVSKFTQGGKTLYSNVTGNDNDKLMSGRPGVSTVPGMSQQAIDAALGGQSAGQTSADNQIRAANLRDGVDINRGTSQEIAGRAASEQETLARSPLGTPGRAFAQKQLVTGQEQATLRRGQDITERDNVRTNNTSLTNSAATNKLGIFNAQREQGNWRDTHAAGRNDAEFTQRQQSKKNLHEDIAGMLPPTADGKPDMDTAARYSVALNADLASKQVELQAKAKAGDAGAAAALADLQKNGHGALGEGYTRNFINGMKVKDLAEKYSTSRFNPTGGRAVLDDAPRTGLRKNSSGFFGLGGSYTNDQGDDIPARAIEGDGSYIGGLRRNDLVRK